MLCIAARMLYGDGIHGDVNASVVCIGGYVITIYQVNGRCRSYQHSAIRVNSAAFPVW